MTVVTQGEGGPDGNNESTLRFPIYIYRNYLSFSRVIKLNAEFIFTFILASCALRIVTESRNIYLQSALSHIYLLL